LQGKGDHVYLSDFGLAKRGLESSGLTRPGSIVGTVDYCAPEQLAGQPVDGRADVYALGCVVFHCLIGQPPYPRDSEPAIVHAHLNEPSPALSSFRSDLPRALDGVLATALAKY